MEVLFIIHVANLYAFIKSSTEIITPSTNIINSSTKIGNQHLHPKLVLCTIKMAANESKSNYSMGYSQAVLASHAARTIYSDAAFVLPHIKETDRILDVGCGPGTITLGFASVVPDGEVVGIDVSDEVLKQAEKNLALSDDAARVSFRRGDVVKGLSDIPDGSFDVVFASQVFPHLATPELRAAAMAEMRRVLRDGGVLATRTIVDAHWLPRSCNLGELFTRRMARGVGADADKFTGCLMPALYRAADFENFTVTAGTTVWATADERRWFADSNAARLAKGDSFRASWLASGLTESDIEESKKALQAWAETEDAWYIGVQADILGWK
ncbi:hypothetical protein RB597_007748 [Gaeumannomyces tritici]